MLFYPRGMRCFLFVSRAMQLQAPFAAFFLACYCLSVCTAVTTLASCTVSTADRVFSFSVSPNGNGTPQTLNMCLSCRLIVVPLLERRSSSTYFVLAGTISMLTRRLICKKCIYKLLPWICSKQLATSSRAQDAALESGLLWLP